MSYRSILGIFAWLFCIMLLSGCSSSPENKVIDYLHNINAILDDGFENQKSCPDITDALKKYCSEQEEIIKTSVADLVQKKSNGNLDKETASEINKSASMIILSPTIVWRCTKEKSMLKAQGEERIQLQEALRAQNKCLEVVKELTE